MSTTRQIAHNTIIQIIGKTFSIFFGLIAIGMMGRYLGTEKFGWYITTITFLQFIGILIDFGLIPVTAQMMSEPEFEKKELFKNLLSFRFFTALIFLGISPLVAIFLPYPEEVKTAILFSTISFLSVAMSQVLVGFYQAKLKMYIQVIAESLSRIVLVVGLWFLIKQQAGFIPVMWVMVISSVTYTLILWVIAAKNTPVGFGFNFSIWKAVIKKMWPISISVIFNVIYLKGDALLLTLFRGQTEVGLYGAAYRVIDILSQTAMMMMGVILPILTFNWSRGLKVEFRKRYQQAFDALMLFAVPITIGTIVLAPQIINLIFEKKFAEAGGALQILAIAVFGVFLGAVFGHTAVAINRQKQTMWIFISDAILTFAGYLIFIPKYGMYGAAWMTVFSELYAGFLLFFMVRHYTQEKLYFKTFGKILFASILMCLALMYFNHLNVILNALIGLLVYGVVLLGIGGISKNTIKEILSIKNTNKI